MFVNKNKNSDLHFIRRFYIIPNATIRSVGRVVMQQIANLWGRLVLHRFESYTLRQEYWYPAFGRDVLFLRCIVQLISI